MYVYKLLNTSPQKKTLVVIFTLHKFKHYVLGNKFLFYVDHMALIYLIFKPQFSRIISKWLLLFTNIFIIIYKPNNTHVIADKLPNTIEPIGVPK